MMFRNAVKEKLQGHTQKDEPIVIAEDDLEPMEECLRDVPQSLTEDDYLGLLMALESSLVSLWKTGRVKEDAQARSMMEWLANFSLPGAETNDSFRYVHGRLKFFLNTEAGKYARRDVRNACNKIMKSIDRHRDATVSDAYLQFIADYIPG